MGSREGYISSCYCADDRFHRKYLVAERFGGQGGLVLTGSTGKQTCAHLETDAAKMTLFLHGTNTVMASVVAVFYCMKISSLCQEMKRMLVLLLNILLGRSQAVRHRVLVPAYGGSNPSAPAMICTPKSGHEKYR